MFNLFVSGKYVVLNLFLSCPDPTVVRLVEAAGGGAEMAAARLLQRGGGGGDHVAAAARWQPQQQEAAAAIGLEEAAPADSPGSWRGVGSGYGVADAVDISDDDSDNTATTEEFEDAGEGSDGSLDSFKVTLADLGVEEPPEPRRVQPALSFCVTDGRVLC